MLFDKLCKVAEREIPALEEKLRSTRLFYFPGKPHEFLPTVIDDEIVKFLKEEFMLPFKNIAVEDDAGLVLIEDIKRNTKGIDNPRKFIDIIRLNTPQEAFRDRFDPFITRRKQELKEEGVSDLDPVILTFGTIDRIHWVSGKEFFAESTLHGGTVIHLNPRNKKFVQHSYSGKDRTIPQDMHTLYLKSATMNAMTAIQEILYTNTPSRFILQISPNQKIKKFRKTDKIPRSDNRPKYILLKPKEIRKIIKEDLPKTSSGRKSPIVHERRAHPRTFHSDRFIKMQGKTIMIPAKWIGISEKVIGSKHYKVMLDM